ncbi:MAG: flippase-like domain-containing protein [Candidatus Brocadiaceae bacterium]|nr:flippase-like domain-containing protein [Candidatus Brocadiaceae bacterium]
MKFNKKNIIFLLSAVISIGCSWLFIKSIEWPSLKNALLEADYWFIIPSTVFALLVYVVRAFRWQGLITHIKPISVLSMLSITSIGFMANNILPARVGEVLRPFLLYKKEKVTFFASFATVIVERIFDMLALIIFTVVIIALLPEPTAIDQETAVHDSMHQMNTVKESFIPALKKWVVVFAATGVITIASLFLIVMKPDFFKKILSLLCFFIPHKFKDKVFGLYDSFVYGLKILENKLQAIWILALSILVWVVGATEIYLLGFSFHMQLPFVGACLVAVCLALAVALPQAPGYIGVFHIAVLKSLTIFGIQTSAAQSYAIALWVISVFPVTIMGFFFLWKEGMAFGEVIKLEEEIAEGKLEEVEGISKDPSKT